MIVETVITSVPRGLKAGRTGFQPVMRTRGLRDDVLRQLEPLTGYRHVHRQGSGQNPANYSYRRLASNVGDLAVLGRTVDAGSDFSNRSNKCGHLIAFTAEELSRFSSTTPAALLAENAGLFASHWTKGPEERAAGPAFAVQPQAPSICSLWQSQFGDAGWAAVVAERARRRQPTLLVAPNSTPQSSELLLQLIREATALLPPAVRWAVSFETTVLGASDALIQGTYRGSPEAEAARAGVLVLPLGGPPPPGQLQENDLCKIARFGQPQPVAATNSPVAPTSSVPTTGEDFLSAPATPGSSGTPPPLLPSHTATQSSTSTTSPAEKRVPWGTIIGASVSFSLTAFVALWLLAFGLDIWPRDNNPQNKNKPIQADATAAQRSPEKTSFEILRGYAKATRYDGDDKPTKPTLANWREWLRKEDKIDESWTDFANAVLRKCEKKSPNAFDKDQKWDRREHDFYSAIQNLIALQPTTYDLSFLLLLNSRPPSELTDLFIKNALSSYKDREKEKQLDPDVIIDKAVNAIELYSIATRLIKETKLDGAEDFVQRLLRLSDKPVRFGFPHKERAELFLTSLREHRSKKNDEGIDFKGLYGYLDKFNKSLKTLTEYAEASDTHQAEPTDDDYRRVFTRLPDGFESPQLNKALKSLKKVPPTADDLANAAKRVVAWDHVKSELEKTPQPVTGRENAFFIAKNIPYFETIAAELIPHISLPDEASTRSADNRIWHTTYQRKQDEEPQDCCTFEASQSGNGTDFLIIFPDNRAAKILSRMPISLDHTGFQKRTADTCISKEPLKYTLSCNKPDDSVPTIAKFVADGEERLLETAPLQGADGIPFTDLLEALGGQQGIECEFETSKDVAEMGGERSKTGQFSCDLLFNKAKPSADGREKGDTKEPEVIAKLEFSLNAANGLVTLDVPDAGHIIADPRLDSDLQENLLKYYSDVSPLIMDIAKLALNINPKNGKEIKDLNEHLKEHLSYIANHQNFGSPNDPFGTKPLRGPNAQIFPTQDFTSPADSPPRQTNRPLIGRIDYADLDKRSWEMTFASFLVKASQEFKDKKTLYESPKNEEIKALEDKIEQLKKNADKYREQIQRIEPRIKKEKEKVRKPIEAWLKTGWVKEIDEIVEKLDPSKVRLDKAKPSGNSEDDPSVGERERLYRERVRICKDLYSKLRPFVARYLLAFHDEEAKEVTLDSLVEVTLLYETPDGGQIEIAKILPPKNTTREQPTPETAKAPADSSKAK